jgi:hypothetical protein
MSAYEILWNLDQESRLSALEAQVKEQKEQIEMLSKWVNYLKDNRGSCVFPVEAHKDLE